MVSRHVDGGGFSNKEARFISLEAEVKRSLSQRYLKYNSFKGKQWTSDTVESMFNTSAASSDLCLA